MTTMSILTLTRDEYVRLQVCRKTFLDLYAANAASICQVRDEMSWPPSQGP